MFSSPVAEDRVTVFMILDDTLDSVLIVLAEPLIHDVLIFILIVRHGACVDAKFGPELRAQLIFKLGVPFVMVLKHPPDETIQQQERADQGVVVETKIEKTIEHVLGLGAILPDDGVGRDDGLDGKAGLVALAKVVKEHVVGLIMTIHAPGPLTMTPIVKHAMTIFNRGAILDVMAGHGFRVHRKREGDAVAQLPMSGHMINQMLVRTITSWGEWSTRELSATEYIGKIQGIGSIPSIA